MARKGGLQAPLLCRLLLRCASWLAPGHARPEWFARWDRALENCTTLYNRGELTRGARRTFWALCRAAFRDALYTRIPEEQLRHRLRSPGFVLLTAVALLVVVGSLSVGFRGTRALFDPLPIQDPDRLVSIRYTGPAGAPSGVPPREIPIWRGRSKLLSDVAGYWRRRRSSHARVTSNFFPLLGTKPAIGRLLRPGDRDLAILSAAEWRHSFDGDPRAIGRHMRVDGDDYTIVGVLPESFWAISPDIAVWTPLTLEPQPDAGLPYLIGAIGRLKHEVAYDQVRVDLFEAAKAANQVLPRRPEVAEFNAIPGPSWPLYLAGILFAVIIAVVLVIKQQFFKVRPGWRYWGYLGPKLLLSVVIPALVWIEVNAFAARHLPPRGPITFFSGMVTALLFLGASVFGFWWSFADQRRRCPVCFEPLAMPVTIGYWSSVLEPVSTELLCASGHGSLCVPETENGEADRWTSLDASWRELFENKSK